MNEEGHNINHYVARDLEILIGRHIQKHINDLYEIAVSLFFEA